MVLYCTVHGGNILRAIIHKFKYHPEDEAVFIVDRDVSSRYCPPIEKVKYYQMPDPFKIADESLPVEEIKERTNKVIAGYLKEIDIDPLKFSHIYVLFDIYNPFTLYFELNSIKYMLVELANDHFHIYANSADIMRTHFIEVMRDMHLGDCGGKNCIKGFLFSGESRRNKVEENAELEIYDYHNTLINLDKKHKRMIIEGYGIDKYDFTAVMLFNSPGVSKDYIEMYKSAMPYKLTDDDSNAVFYSFYRTVIDYYFNDIDFVLKLHPNSDEKFEKAFSDFVQLPKEVAMEAFFLLDKKFDVFCPARSNSITVFKAHGYNVVNFDRSIFNFMRQIHFVFLAFTLINAVCPPETIFTYGIEPGQVINFANWVYKENKDVNIRRTNRSTVKEAAFILADKVDDDFMEIIKEAPEDCLIIFNGSRLTDDRLFAKQEMIYSIIDVSGEKEVPRRLCSWTVMSKNRELLDAVRGFSASYLLERTKMKIQSEPHN